MMTRTLNINNQTTCDIVIVCQNDFQQVVEADTRVKIEIPYTETIRFFKKKQPSAKFCIGQFFMKETLRNVWLFNIILLLNFDTIITLPKAIKNIDINEKYYHYSIFTLFSLLTVDEKFFKAHYDFHNKTDKRKLAVSLLYLIPVFCISIVLFALTVCGIFLNFDFSFEAIVIYLLSTGFILIFIGLIKSANKFRNFPKYTIDEIKNIKPAEIIKSVNNFIKYRETD